MSERYHIYLGDMHTNIHQHQVSTLDRTFRAARSRMDFFPVAYYPSEYHNTPEGLAVEVMKQQHDAYREDWHGILSAVRKYNNPGRFITFAGYEWHGDRRHFGDHNV